jgi:hypothetical protein
MIGVIFMLGSEMIEVRVEGANALFRSGSQPGLSPIDGLHLDFNGVCKEFPDLVEAEDWRAQAIERFKDKLKCLKTETDRIEYIILDLGKHGYIPKYIQKGGHRVKRIDNDKWRELIQ